MDIQQAINQVLARKDLSVDEMQSVMSIIMTGEATPAQIGGFLVGLRMKGETVAEITAAAGVMRELATKVNVLRIVCPYSYVIVIYSSTMRNLGSCLFRSPPYR